MRIGMPTTSYPRDDGDAGGRFVRELARALVRRGHVIEILAPSIAGATLEESTRSASAPAGLADEGITVRRISYAPRALERTFGRHGAPDNLRTDPLAWAGAASFPIALALACRKHHARWDAVMSHWAIPSALSVAPFLAGRPHVAVLHGGDVDVAARLPAPVSRAIARSATLLAFVSAGLRARLAPNLGAARTVVQPMGIDSTETHGIDRTAARARWRFSRTTVLAMSRLVTIKGLERAIQAMDRVQGADLVIAGDGPERSRLESLARGSRVRFLGHLAGRARLDALAGADVFVAPSRELDGRTEGTPTAVLEALAAGLPVVAARTGGIAEVVTHDETGLLSSGTPDALAWDLTRLAEDAALRTKLGANARARAATFDVNVVAERFEGWLSER